MRVRGLVFDLSVPKYLLARAVGKRLPRIHYGRGSCLSLREVPAPRAPGPGWVKLKPRLTGLCGSDLGTIFFEASPMLEPFNSFPAVLGHEILAEVVDFGTEVAGVERGQRVVVNPLLPCRLREIDPPCPACARGEENGCERVAEGCLAPGQMIGFQRDLPGGMADELVAHHTMLFPVPNAISDEAAVLVEPLAVATHAVLKNPPGSGERVLIIGGGPVAFAVLWALRALAHGNEITVMMREPYQLELARAMGADETIRVTDELAQAREIARRTGGKVYRPTIGGPALAGGYERVFECVGNAASVQDALRYTRPLGRVVLIGAAGILSRVDWTPVWRNEITVAGSYTYGPENFRGRRAHTFEVVLGLLRDREGPDPTPLLTHRFALEQYRDAIIACVDRRRHKSVKAAFDFRAQMGRTG